MERMQAYGQTKLILQILQLETRKRHEEGQCKDMRRWMEVRGIELKGAESPIELNSAADALSLGLLCILIIAEHYLLRLACNLFKIIT